MSWFDGATKKMAEIFEKFNEIKIRMDYVEKGTKENMQEFKAIIDKFNDRLDKIEHDLINTKTEFTSEINKLNTLFEAVYKDSIKSSVEQFTSKEFIKKVLEESESLKKLNDDKL